MTNPNPIYLDHAATTPMLEPVLLAMMPFLTARFGNPSSVHVLGRDARHTIEKCRNSVAEIIGATPAEIVFTSGGSESNNTAINSAARVIQGSFVTSSAEHEAVLEPVKSLPSGRIMSPDNQGRVGVDALAAESIEGGAVSIMLVNNELGSVNPVQKLASFCRRQGALIHSDAVQAARVMDLRPIIDCVDYLSLSGHKIGGPKGVGILFVKGGVPHTRLILGGGQEQDRRAGTENVASIVGFTTALEIASANRQDFASKCYDMRSALVNGLKTELGALIRVNSPEADCSNHIVNLIFTDQDGRGLDSEMLLLGLDIEGVCVSAGSACSSGTVKSSHVLSAIGLSEEESRGAIRVSFGPQTSIEEVEETVRRMKKVSLRMRS